MPTAEKLNQMWSDAVNSGDPTAGNLHLRYARAVEAEVRKEIESSVMAETKACATLVSSLYKPGRHMSDYDSGFNWGIGYAEQSILGRLQPAPTSAQKEESWR